MTDEIVIAVNVEMAVIFAALRTAAKIVVNDDRVRKPTREVLRAESSCRFQHCIGFPLEPNTDALDHVGGHVLAELGEFGLAEERAIMDEAAVLIDRGHGGPHAAAAGLPPLEFDARREATVSERSSWTDNGGASSRTVS
jgi:hypothetical protein